MYYDNFNSSSLPRGVRNLLIFTGAVFILQVIPGIGEWIKNYGSLVPSLVYKNVQLWRIATYIFLHGNAWHLLFNMLALWMFGVEIERMWGTKRFIIFYMIGGIGSGMLSFPMWYSHIIGASGAVLALLTVYAYYFPDRKILMFFIFPVPVRVAVIIIGAISILMSYSGDGIAHFTHLAGIIIAIFYLKYYNQFVSLFTHFQAVNAEKTMRKQAEKKIMKDRYFEEVIDPILKKISTHGMESLSKEEQKKLQNYKR
ncbi:MAG: rhomboid family intramembrane serine protease [Chitinispirillia bacterium]|jgi:membrane associated rhomboid family serine protease